MPLSIYTITVIRKYFLTGTVCDNITLSYRFYVDETKTERLFPLYETPHPFRRNGRTVLKRFIAEYNDEERFAPCCTCSFAPCCCYSFAEMFLCPLETLHFILLAIQLAIGTVSERPAQSSATRGLSSESWCGHGVKVEHATEPRSFHRRPSSSAQRVLSQAPSSSLVGLNRVFSRCYSSPCAFVETVAYPHSVSYQGFLS